MSDTAAAPVGLKLCIDSAGDTALLVLGHGEELLGFSEVTPQHDTDRIGLLLESLHLLCRQQQVRLDDLALVSVVVNPGRFTGLRLGMALAQGLTLASERPLVTCRREEVYRPLMRTQQGLLLCESGKAVAFGGYWQGRVCAPLQLWKPQSSKAEQVLSFLSESALKKHYPELYGDPNIRIEYPGLQQRAEALLLSTARSV